MKTLLSTTVLVVLLSILIFNLLLVRAVEVCTNSITGARECADITGSDPRKMTQCIEDTLWLHSDWSFDQTVEHCKLEIQITG